MLHFFSSLLNSLRTARGRFREQRELRRRVETIALQTFASLKPRLSDPRIHYRGERSGVHIVVAAFQDELPARPFRQMFLEVDLLTGTAVENPDLESKFRLRVK